MSDERSTISGARLLDLLAEDLLIYFGTDYDRDDFEEVRSRIVLRRAGEDPNWYAKLLRPSSDEEKFWGHVLEENEALYDLNAGPMPTEPREPTRPSRGNTGIADDYHNDDPIAEPEKTERDEHGFDKDWNHSSFPESE